MTRFYRQYAPWWPLISPVEDYAEEAAYVARMLRRGTREVKHVLELGSGGGHNAAHLASDFELTLVDLSEDMLALSRTLNPSCRHVCGDMRTVRLGTSFDAVFVHDAVEYMTTEEDLSLAMKTAWEHLAPGGVAFFLPDDVKESFEEDSDHGGNTAADGRAVRYLEWTWDPDPNDSWVQTEYSFVFRTADGAITSAHETHRLGLFARAKWCELLAAQGFEPQMVEEETNEERDPRTGFVAYRPPA